MDDAAIHRVSGVADRQCGSFIENQWIATGYALAMTRVMVSPSLFTLKVSSLGSFGLAPPQAKTFLAYSLLAFLETYTEADVVLSKTRVVIISCR